MNRADVAHAALMEAGRPDLANLLMYFQEDDGTWYLEPMDDANLVDMELMIRADLIAIASVGLDL